MVTKQKYIHYSLHVVLCLPFYIYNYVKNIFKHALFNMHDIIIMTEEISLPIRKLLKNTLLYPIVGHTKTRKLLLNELKNKYNVIVLWYHVIQFFTQRYRWCNISFNSTNKEVLYVLIISWQEPSVVKKKRHFTIIC